jgi:hypothetical protein
MNCNICKIKSRSQKEYEAHCERASHKSKLEIYNQIRDKENIIKDLNLKIETLHLKNKIYKHTLCEIMSQNRKSNPCF